MKILMAMLALVLLAGCATVDRVSDRTAHVVHDICAMDEIDRAAVRLRADELTEPHEVRVRCDGEAQ